MRQTLLIAACLLAVTPSRGALAQDLSAPPPQIRPGWYARTHFLQDIPARDRAIIDQNLTVAERLLAATPGYANPRGFEVKAHWTSETPVNAATLRTYGVAMRTYVPDWKTTSGHADAPAQIIINPELSRLSEGMVKSATGEGYYHERQRSPAGYGATLVYGQYGVPNSTLLVLFTTRNQDPMLPVSREEYLRARIHELDGDGSLKKAQASTGKTPYQEWMDGAAKRKADRQATLARMADKAAAEKLRAMYEKQETDMTEGLKKREATDAENIRTMKALDPSKRLRDQLEAMTAEERASPAWAGGTDLMPAGAPNALRVVRANPALFRATGSPAEPRAILVILREERSAAMVEAQNLLHRELDWAAVRRMLDPKP